MKADRQTRREFIRLASLAAAGAPWLASMSSQARAADPNRKIGFALCGLGGLSTNQLAPALQTTKHCRLAGIITGTPAKAAAWKAKYNIPDKNIYNYETMTKLGDNPDIDVVYVVTPNALHGDLTVKAAKAGKHVLSEKPMEVSVEKCQQMIDACKAAKRMLAIGYRNRFEPHTMECIRLAREKVLGPVKKIQAGFGFKIGDPTQWRLKHALSGGGALMDVGIYALQTARYISGQEPVEVAAKETKTDPVKFKEVDETMVFLLKFPDGVTASCQTTFNAFGWNSYTVEAEKGWFGLGPAYGYDGVQGRRSDGQAIDMPAVDQFAAEMDDFSQCILNNKPTIVPGEEGLRDVKIMLAIYESAKSGQPVKVVCA
jgi:predicted dehydrogenase